jgi:hypothetical protein
MASDSEERLVPRLIRFRDAPFYLGMDRNRFNAEVRPLLTEIPLGAQGIAFDRLDLDAWVDQYKSRNGRPALRKGVNASWDANAVSDSANAEASGTFRSKSEAMERLMKAAERRTSRKRNGISPTG